MALIKTSPNEPSETTLKKLTYTHGMHPKHSKRLLLAALPVNMQN
jgi:hypothetical protein